MKTLILTRHAKSDWGNLTMRDHERTLNVQGQASAIAIGKWLNTNGYHPQQAISSDAMRCIETWNLLNEELPEIKKFSFHQRLYLASSVTLYEVIKQAREDIVLMVGHNPGISELASELTSQIPDHPKFLQYPTTATTILTFDIQDWSTPFMGQGTITTFIVPNDLTD